jgi:hypothetical protein
MIQVDPIEPILSILWLMPLRIEISHMRDFRWLWLHIYILLTILSLFQTIEKLLGLLHTFKVVVLDYYQVSFTWVLYLLPIFEICWLFQRIRHLISFQTGIVPSIWALINNFVSTAILIWPFILHTLSLSTVLIGTIPIRFLQRWFVQRSNLLLVHGILLRISAFVIHYQVVFFLVKLVGVIRPSWISACEVVIIILNEWGGALIRLHWVSLVLLLQFLKIILQYFILPLGFLSGVVPRDKFVVVIRSRLWGVCELISSLLDLDALRPLLTLVWSGALLHALVGVHGIPVHNQVAHVFNRQFCNQLLLLDLALRVVSWFIVDVDFHFGVVNIEDAILSEFRLVLLRLIRLNLTVGQSLGAHHHGLLLILLLGCFALELLAQGLLGALVRGILKLLDAVWVDLPNKLVVEIVIPEKVALACACVQGRQIALHAVVLILNEIRLAS